jgi:hypothetical protein
MAGIKGQGRVQKLILRELEVSPVLSLRVLNPSGNKSKQKALRRSVKKLVQSGAVTRLKVIVPSSPVPIVHSVVAKAGTTVLGIQTVFRTDIVEPVAEPVAEGEIPMTLEDRIERLQKRIG